MTPNLAARCAALRSVSFASRSTLLRTPTFAERSVGSLGIGAVAVSSPAADRGSDPDAALEDVVETTAASRARGALAADAAPALAELAHAVGSGAGRRRVGTKTTTTRERRTLARNP